MLIAAAPPDLLPESSNQLKRLGSHVAELRTMRLVLSLNSQLIEQCEKHD